MFYGYVTYGEKVNELHAHSIKSNELMNFGLFLYERLTLRY
jgi:hypothetical protein